MQITAAIGIVAILACVVALNILPRQFEARLNKARQDIVHLSTAIEQYKVDNHTYPAQLSDLVTVNSTQPPLIDPWGNAYRYRVPGTTEPFEVFSLGRDGHYSGTGKAQDISSP